MLLDDAEDADKLDAVAGGHFVSEFAVNGDLEGARHLSSRDQLRSLLQLKRLLVEELALFGDNAVGVERTTRTLVSHRGLSIGALPAGLGTTEAEFELLLIGVVAGGAAPRDRGRLDRSPARGRDDTWHHDQLAHHVRGQVSQVAGVLVAEDLDLPIRDGVVSIATDRLVIVVVVNFLSGALQHWDEALWVAADLHGKLLVEVKEELHVDLDVEATFSRIPLQLLPTRRNRVPG